MKTRYFALGLCAFAATGCIIESHPANSTPETAPSASSTAQPGTSPTVPAPTATTAPPPAPQPGVPPPMREAPKQ